MTAENPSIPLLDLKAAESTGVALTPGSLPGGVSESIVWL